jgi:phosphatidylinositol-3-phosphatase
VIPTTRYRSVFTVRYLVAVLLSPLMILSVASCQTPSPRPASTGTAWRHLVIVVEENHSFGQIIGNEHAPYLNSLAQSGILFTNSFAITHPSEPNYLALFSGSTHGVQADPCSETVPGPSLPGQLLKSGWTFAAYTEGLPSRGSTRCGKGSYTRKDVPWADFTDYPPGLDQPFTAWPHHFAALPTVSVVIPNLDHDMHSASVSRGDQWLRTHFANYVAWARHHDSALLVTWDEDNRRAHNHIPTVLVGAHVPVRHYAARVDHYTVLRTIEWSYGLSPLGEAARRRPVTIVRSAPGITSSSAARR